MTNSPSVIVSISAKWESTLLEYLSTSCDFPTLKKNAALGKTHGEINLLQGFLAFFLEGETDLDHNLVELSVATNISE